MTLRAGTRLGPYEILAPLGAGGMGEVYRARDTRLGREVAVKVLPSSLSADASRLGRFEQEARAAGILNHPNILVIYDVGTHEGSPYVVSELLEGETLRDRLGGTALPSRKAIDYAIQVARGLAAAHEKRITHRDLKPENLFITRDGRIKILDFGLAKLTSPEGSSLLTNAPTALNPINTEPGMVFGTVGYMSPEQVRGQSADQRSDIFTFGAILYEMLAGTRAFRHDSAAETMNAILKEEPPDLLETNRNIAPALDRIVGHCLEKNPEERFQSVRDVAFDLEALSGSSAVIAPLSVSTWSLAKNVRVAAVVALAVVTAFALGWLIHSVPVQNTAPSFTRVVRLVATPAQEFGPAISPDGKWVAYLSDARGMVDVWVKFVAGGEAVNLTASAGLEIQSATGIGGVEISPDGTSIAFDAGPKGAPGTLLDAWVIPAPLGGVPRKLVPRGRSVRWSPDGRRITYIWASATAGDALFVADADGGNSREIVSARGGMHVHWPAWSRDGKYIYFIYTIAGGNVEPSEIFRVPSSGGKLEPVVSTSRRALFPLPTPDGKGLIYAANPAGTDLNLWWRPLHGGEPQRLTTGIGEYAEPRMSSDGRSMVCTLFDFRHSLVAVPVTLGRSVETRPITEGYTGDLDPCLSLQGDRLVFSSSRSGSRNLWMALPDGTQPRPLTSGIALDERPAFSPDGQQIAFVSDRGGQRGIWVMSADGGVPRLLVTAPVLDTLTWSPDGRQIAYAAPAGDLPGLWVVSVSDGQVKRLSTPAAAHSPAWAPKGDVIAYLEPRRQTALAGTAFTGLKFVSSSGQPLYTNLPEGPHLGGGFLAWAPGGRRLAIAPQPGATKSTIWIVEPEGPEPFRKLLETPVGTRLRGVTWTGDGSSLIVGQFRASSDIVLFDQAR